MATRRCFIGLTIAVIFVIGIWPLGSVPKAAAETLKFRLFNQVTKTEFLPIADVEGHVIIPNIREGAIILENGELGWSKSTLINDFIKAAGTVDAYSTYTFQDGSTITTRTKGTVGATPQGVPLEGKLTGDIIHGTGRFQGIKGTVTQSAKLLPPTERGAGAQGNWRSHLSLYLAEQVIL